MDPFDHQSDVLHQSDALPDDARQSGSPSAVLPPEPLDEWPLKAESYDASEDKNRNSGRKVLIGTIIVYLVLVAIGVPGLVLAIRDGETLSHQVTADRRGRRAERP